MRKTLQLEGSVDGWSQEQMENFIEEQQISAVRPAASIILQISVSST